MRPITPCRCASPSHERPLCDGGRVASLRGSFFKGIYDAPSAVLPTRSAVRLLNPAYGGGDPVALRFAQIEID